MKSLKLKFYTENNPQKTITTTIIDARPKTLKK